MSRIDDKYSPFTLCRRGVVFLKLLNKALSNRAVNVDLKTDILINNASSTIMWCLWVSTPTCDCRVYLIKKL